MITAALPAFGAHSPIQLPPAVVTGIGSLPFRDPHTAVQCVAQTCPLLPFWPELPLYAPEACLVEQVCGPFVDLLRPRLAGYGYDVVTSRLDALLERLEQAPACLEPARSPGFFAFEQAVATGTFAHAVAFKGQLIGPLTLAWQLFAAGVPLITLPAYRAAIGRYLARLARWQIERLAQWGKPVLLCIDEPCLVLSPPPDAPAVNSSLAVLDDLLAMLRRPGVMLGVHTCARLPQHHESFAAVCQMRPDMLFFDAYQDLEAFCAAPAAQDFLRQGGHVAFGLVPTWQGLDEVTPAGLFERWRAAVTEVMALETVARQTLITASCGLGLLPASAVGPSFQLASQLAQRIRQVAQAGSRRA